MFGGSVRFKIAGSDKYGTWPGVLVTLITYVLVLCYFYQKFTIMLLYEDTSH